MLNILLSPYYNLSCYHKIVFYVRNLFGSFVKVARIYLNFIMDFIGLAVAGGVTASFGIGWCAKKVYQHIKTNRSIREVESEGWTHIGKVKFVCLYPIDGGRGFKLDMVNFGRYGLQTLPDITDGTPRVDYDRYVLFFLYFIFCNAISIIP